MNLRTFIKLLPGLMAVPFVKKLPSIPILEKEIFVTGWGVGKNNLRAMMYRRIDEGMEKSLQEYKMWEIADCAYANPPSQMMVEALVDLQRWYPCLKGNS